MLDPRDFIKFEWKVAGENELSLALPDGTTAQISGTLLELRLPEQPTHRHEYPSVENAKENAIQRWHCWIMKRLAKAHRSGPANTICVPLRD